MRSTSDLFRLAGALMVILGALASCNTKRSQEDRRREVAAVEPVRVGVLREVDPTEMLRLRGRGLFQSRGGCMACHRLGERGDGLKGPNLGVGNGMTEPIGVRGAKRVNGLSAIEYIVASIVDPDGFIVPSYVRGIMRRVDEPPLSLRDEEIVAIAAFLAGEGGTQVTTADVSKAHAHIAVARSQRQQRAK